MEKTACAGGEIAIFSMGGPGMGSDLVVAWPGAEIGFMDPVVGANVLHGTELDTLDGDARRDELWRHARELGSDFDPRAITTAMTDIIEPEDTHACSAAALDRLSAHPRVGDHPERARPLAALVLTGGLVRHAPRRCVRTAGRTSFVSFSTSHVGKGHKPVVWATGRAWAAPGQAGASSSHARSGHETTVAFARVPSGLKNGRSPDAVHRRIWRNCG